MNLGLVVAIFIAPDKGLPMQSITEPIKVIEGVGLEGDRYALQKGAFSNSKREVIRHVTFIEREVVANTGFKLAETRRNIVTYGVSLNDLVGVEFLVGWVKFRGVELCDPCDRPSKLSGKPDFKELFDNRGGLRAEVLSTGFIQIGNSVWVS